MSTQKRAILKKGSAEEPKTIPQFYDEEAAVASADPSTSGQFPLFKDVRSAMYKQRAKRAHDVLLQPGLRVSFNAPFTTRQQTMMRLHNKSEKPIMWVVKSNLGKKITINPCSGVLEPNSAVNIHLVLFPFNYSQGPEERLTIETAVILPLMEKKFDQDFLQICEILNRIPISIHYNF
ncbi:putative MSP domain protein [Trichinella spiralis]|uniref:putative MSP domain protein n=1 Tax=Trichinella spiralis TaxID=6334 RepID=UPI0001EFD7F1|nr:putative MSP domain protein [Trichinella spiralis]